MSPDQRARALRLADVLDSFYQREVLETASFLRELAAEPERVPLTDAMSRHSRAMLLNVLWHHQGANSAVGQPLRGLLGIGRFDHLSDEQLSEAKWIDALLSKAVREPERVPLTDERALELAGTFNDAYDDSWVSPPDVPDRIIVAFIRAVERAHGIVGGGK